MSAIVIDHHRSAEACCQDCQDRWATSRDTPVTAVLSRAAEHAIASGHTVAEHVTDDVVVRPGE